MKRAVLFGAGSIGRILYEQLGDTYDFVYATDNDESKYGQSLAPTCPLVIKDKQELKKKDFECVIISTYAGFEEVYDQLTKEFGLDDTQIISRYVEHAIRAKYQFLESFAKIVYDKDIQGDVCEVGVYRGGFSKEINRAFPDRNLYLFDTFEGHDARDVEIENAKYGTESKPGDLAMTSEDLVISVLPFPNKAIIKKGYFPETFDLINNKFAFVNIDVDLYAPTKAALELYYPRMSAGGVIVVHDYFFSHLKGAKAAADEFCDKNSLSIMPIGDGISVAIVKNKENR